MLRHQKHDILRDPFTSAYDPKHHSPGCDDSGVFLEDPVLSSPETPAKSGRRRDDRMRQYALPEPLDSDAEKSDDLGLASSSVDSADDLDGDPLPSTLRHKPPPVPARKSLPRSPDVQLKPTLTKSSSSGEDSNFDPYEDPYCDKNIPKYVDAVQLNSQNIPKYVDADDFPRKDSLVDEVSSHESKTIFLARTLSSTQPLKHLDVPASSLKWKSEECLRTAAENRWSLPGRRYEKSVSVKDRIAMFSEMESNQGPAKKDPLPRYGSENNIKAVAAPVDKKPDPKPNGLSRDSKWQSMQNIDKKQIGKEIYTNQTIKPALSIPSLLSSSALESPYAPIKLEVEPPKPIVSTYPETQLTNNKRYNYGLYSLKNLKNTEDLLSKKVAGSNLLSIIDTRKQPVRKLKGLVIPDKPPSQESLKTLPTLIASDSETTKDRRASLPITVVTASMSLPRNKCQKQTSLSDPPWKTERTHTNTLPKYSPAFKKRSLELPGSSLSPTPPSSLTSPLSPPPSSPSSVCSSNASSSLLQNVFQFSLSHSKPVKPLQPEKALMSPPGEMSEEFKAVPAVVPPVCEPKEEPEPVQPSPGVGHLHYGMPNVFTSSTKSVALQPLLVEALVKTPCPPPRAAVCISKTEIHLRRDAPKVNSHESEVNSLNKKSDFVDTRTPQSTDFSNGPNRLSNGKMDVPPVGKFRASPLQLPRQEGVVPSKCRDRRPLLPSECDDSDDDSHSTLSHRTEHTTTDDCLSDATTDSFEKPPRTLLPRTTVPAYDDSASTEGYLSDASTDVSLRRFGHRPVDAYSAEEYLSDATAESPDPDWVSNRTQDTRYRGHLRNSDPYRDDSDSVDPDLRPKRLSQQRTVLRAMAEPSGSVQKFKALAEKWEQRVVSPPPPPVTAAPATQKRDAKVNATVIQPPTAAPTPKGKGSLPPSLMPRNARGPPPTQHSSPSAETNGWTHQEELSRGTRSDSTSSDSSKATVKEEEEEGSSTTVLLVDSLQKELTANGHRTNSGPPKASWNNEPRCRRGADFSWSSRPNFASKSSVSDIRRSFENGHQEAPLKKTPPTAAVTTTPPVVAVAARTPSPEEAEEEVAALVEGARRQLQEERGGCHLVVLAINLLREGGMDGGSVGITLAGGADYEVKEITVHKVIAGSIADRDGRVLKGDRLMSINGRDLRGVSHGEALHILKAPNPRVLLVVARNTQLQQAPNQPTRPSRPPTDSFMVELQKDATGLGFSIEGGKDSPQGDRPLLIKRVFKGGAADKEGQLGEGDEILSVNSHPMANMTRTEAWNYLKKLPEGPVRLQLRKNVS